MSYNLSDLTTAQLASLVSLRKKLDKQVAKLKKLEGDISNTRLQIDGVPNGATLLSARKTPVSTHNAGFEERAALVYQAIKDNQPVTITGLLKAPSLSDWGKVKLDNFLRNNAKKIGAYRNDEWQWSVK